MQLEAEGYLAVPVLALRKTIAASARFQQIVGSASAEAALEHTHEQLFDDEEQEGTDLDDKKLAHPRPRAIVFTTESWMRERRGPGEWNVECSLAAGFELIVPAEYDSDHDSRSRWFLNQMGVILAEMETARDADTAGDYLPFHRINLITDPMPCYEPVNIERYWGCEVAFSYL